MASFVKVWFKIMFWFKMKCVFYVDYVLGQDLKLNSCTFWLLRCMVNGNDLTKLKMVNLSSEGPTVDVNDLTVDGQPSTVDGDVCFVKKLGLRFDGR